MKVPLVDLAAQHAEVADEVRAGLDAVFAATAFVGGPDVAAFEREYAALVDVDHCVGVANGTDAVELALRAVGVEAGGEVILPANTFIATAEAVSRIGAIPVPVDVDPRHLLIDPTAVERAFTPRTQAVVPVHLYGQCAPVDHLTYICAAAGVPLVEDAAQAQGALHRGRPAGALGRAAATSFYPGKNLGAAGDAGAVTTDDPDLAQRVRVMGAHGSPARYVHEVVGHELPPRHRPGRLPAGQAEPAGEVERAAPRGGPPVRRAARRRRGRRDAVGGARQRARVAPVRRPGRRARRACWERCTRPGWGRRSTTRRRST